MIVRSMVTDPTMDVKGNEGLTILLVEDNDGDARLVCEYLRDSRRQIIVDHVRSLDAAAAVPHADLALLDLGVPGSAGLDTLRRFQHLHPGMPVVVLTGLDDRELALEALRHGAEDYVVKERLTPDALERLLRYSVERHHVRRQLEMREEELALILTQVPGTVWTTDASLRFTRSIGSALERFGLMQDEVVGLELGKFLGEPEGEAVQAHRQALAGGNGVYTWEQAGRHWRAVTSPITAADGSISGVIGLALDDSDAVEMARHLQESEERFRQLAEHAQDVIYRLRIEPDLAFEYVNPALVQMAGYTPEEVYADPRVLLETVLDPEDRFTEEDVRDRAHAAPESEEPFRVRWIHRDGSKRWVEEQHSPIHDERGNLVAVQGIVRDVTAQARYEEALRAALEQEREVGDRLRRLDEMKNTFLSAVSHELRTPLTTIQGFAQVLQARHDELSSEQITMMLDRLARNAVRLGELLTDLLDIDRLSRGGALEPVLLDTDVGALVMSVLGEVELPDHPVTLNVEPVMASIDAPKIERVVRNLVANAGRHTPRGTPVWIGVRPDGDDVRISVEDGGPGVPDELKPAIFEAFEVGMSGAARVGGAGIGLTIVSRFVDLHHGSVWVEDRPGGGAAFHVLLPRRVGVRETALPQESPAP